MSLKELIKSDLARFTQTFKLRGEPYSKIRVVIESFLFKAGFQAVFLYRISHWLHCVGWNYTAWFLTRVSVTLTGAEIEYNAQIGPGMFIAHPVGIMIGRGTVIGSGSTIFQGVTFGAKDWSQDSIRQFPQVGDNCYFFANSVIIGDITIGDNCIVGAQTVVNCNMPEGCMAVGVPAKLYPDKGRKSIESWNNKGGLS